MKLQMYLPTTTNDYKGVFSTYTINNPLIYQDILFYDLMYPYLYEYFPEIAEQPTVLMEGEQTNKSSRYVFVAGEKAFAPSLASLPVFAIQRTNIPQLNSEEFHMGAAQLVDHRWYIQGKDSTQDPDYYYGRVIPIKVSYTMDMWASSRTDITKFGLFYNDLFARSGLVRGRISNISLQEVNSGTYTELPFFVKQGGNGITENIEALMGGINSNLNYATANFDVDSFYLKINPTKPYTELIIHWLMNYHLEDRMEVYNESGVDITSTYRDYWNNLITEYEYSHHEIIEETDIKTYRNSIYTSKDILKNR